MFPYIEVNGTHRQIGQAIGESLRTEIDQSLRAHFRKLHEREQKKAAQAITQLTKSVQKYFPRFVEEVQGIAEGSGHPFEQLLLFSFEEELIPAERCTTVAVKGKKTIYFAHNEDWDLGLALYIIKAKPKGKPAFLSVANAGQFPGAIGFNEKGVAFSNNSLSTRLYPAGVPKMYIFRSFLECGTIKDALKAIVQRPRAIGNNSVLVSEKEQRIVDVEWSSKAYRLTEAERGIGHTNHYLTNLLKLQTEKTSYSSEQRLIHIEEKLLQLEQPKLSDIKRLMRTHINSRVSICRHTGWKTITSVIVDTAARKMYVSNGTPCDHPYRTFGL